MFYKKYFHIQFRRVNHTYRVEVDYRPTLLGRFLLLPSFRKAYLGNSTTFFDADNGQRCSYRKEREIIGYVEAALMDEVRKRYGVK